MSAENCTRERAQGKVKALEMISSLFGLLPEIIDDRGMVLAASQSPMSAFSAFARSAESSPGGKNLRYFGIPATRLQELDSLPETNSFGLIVSGEDGGDWESDRVHDAERLNSFQVKWDERIEIKTYSVLAPPKISIEKTYESLRGFASVDVQVVLQDPIELSDAIAMAADREWISLAIDASALRDVDLVSRFIVECCSLECPFQILGLEGALATSNQGLGVLNVIVASVSAFVHELSLAETTRLLRNPEVVSLTAEGSKSDAGQIEHAQDFFWELEFQVSPRFLKTSGDNSDGEDRMPQQSACLRYNLRRYFSDLRMHL